MAKKHVQSQLRRFLKGARAAKDLTLRDVEDETEISNAYLSQIESGKIRQPSPNVLHQLCELYGVPYELAMQYAGFPVPDGSKPELKEAKFLSRFGVISEKEDQELAEYLDFLRSRRKKG